MGMFRAADVLALPGGGLQCLCRILCFSLYAHFQFVEGKRVSAVLPEARVRAVAKDSSSTCQWDTIRMVCSLATDYKVRPAVPDGLCCLDLSRVTFGPEEGSHAEHN